MLPLLHDYPHVVQNFNKITLFSRSTMYIDDLIILENILKKNIDAIRIAKSCDDVQFESIYDELVELVDTFTKNYNIRYDDVIKL